MMMRAPKNVIPMLHVPILEARIIVLVAKGTLEMVSNVHVRLVIMLILISLNLVIHLLKFSYIWFIAICNRTCENGGLCIAPDVCSCRSGWIGAQCETDLDECLQERNSSDNVTSALCPENAICVNKPGWYLCECKEGFQAFLSHTGEAQCQGRDDFKTFPLVM